MVRSTPLVPAALALLLAACDTPTGELPPTRAPDAQLANLDAGTDASVSKLLVLSVTASDLAVPYVFNLPIVSGAASATLDLPIGKTRQITALAYAADGTETERGGLSVTVVSGTNPAVRLVAAARYPGDPSINVSLGIVGHTPRGSIVVSGGPVSLVSGQAAQLSGTYVDPKFGPMSGRPITFASQDPARATVDAKGRVTPHGSGQVRIVLLSQGEAAGQAILNVSGFGWKTTAAGNRTGCAVAQVNGLTYCWGELPGASLPYKSATPVPLPGNLSLTTLAVGDRRVCGLSGAGEIYCSGSVVSASPLAPLVDPFHVVITGHTFVQISAGANHLCALSTSGEVWCWGRNFRGELGVPPNAAQTEVVPVQVRTRSGERFTSISAGTYFTCGVSTASFAYCWGNNEAGQLGVGDHVGTWQPEPVALASTVSGVSTGEYVACALIQTPLATVCWGSNDQGALGIASTIPELDAPQTAVSLPRQPGAVAVGSYGVCVAGTPGSPTLPVDPLSRPPEAYCWGRNSDGENGNGTKTASSWPVAILRSNGFVAISRGYDFTCALTRIGVQYCWGDAQVGQLGVVVDSAMSVPQRVPAP